MRYNKNLLDKYVEENNIILTETYENKINRETIIKGKCKKNCGNKFEKKFRYLYENGGPYCKVCIKEESQNKSKETCTKKYGVEYTFQSDNNKNKSKKTCIEKYDVDICSKNKEIQEKMKNTLMKKYGVEHTFKSKIIKEKGKETMKLKYGVEYPSQNKDIREKMMNTCLKIYGEKYPTQNKKIYEKSKNTCLSNYENECYFKNKDFKEKSRQTCLEKYGVEHQTKNKEVQEKKQKTCLKKYGVKCVLQNNDIVREKIKKTNIKKYGVEYPSQCAEILEKQQKNSFKNKKYISKTGKEYTYQGYEHYALDEIINNQNINENEIINLKKDVPEIWYIDFEEKRRRHFVDIYIKNLNKCIEVKSEYTMTLNTENIMKKQEYAKKSGLEYEIWIFNKNGNIIRKII